MINYLKMIEIDRERERLVYIFGNGYEWVKRLGHTRLDIFLRPEMICFVG
jgi:hypothetical protein